MMASHILFLFCVLVPFCCCFLTDNTQSSHHDSTGDLLAILVEEKDLRHQLAEAVTQMKSEVDVLKSNFSNLQSENAALKQTLNNNTDANTHVIQNLQQTLNNLQSENAALKQTLNNNTDANTHVIQNLQQTLNNLQSENAALKQTLKNVTDANKHDIQNLQQTLNGLQSENAALKQTLQNITDANTHDIQNLQQTLNETLQPKQQVIFSTFLDGITFAAHQPLNFSKIFVNIGGGYQNGVFTCPVAGVYMFSVTLAAHSTQDIGFIYLNERVLTSYLLPYDQTNVDSGSDTFYTHLNVGDRIRLLSVLSIGYIYSYFSGMLIQ